MLRDTIRDTFESPQAASTFWSLPLFRELAVTWCWWLHIRPLPLTLLPHSSILKGASLSRYLVYVDNLEFSILKFLICSNPSCSVSQALMIKIWVFGDTHSEYHIHLILRVPTKTNSKKKPTNRRHLVLGWWFPSTFFLLPQVLSQWTTVCN